MAYDFKNLTVLVVDDDITMKLLFFNIFKRLNVKECFVAQTADEAIQLFDEHEPDIVFTDYLMAQMDGVELTKLLRDRDKKNARMTPIILSSGAADRKLVSDALDSGVTEFLLKPFSINDLTKRLSYIVSVPRSCIDVEKYYGPDRRRSKGVGYKGPERRRDS